MVQHARLLHADHIKISKGQPAGIAFQILLQQFMKPISWDYYRLNAAVVKIFPQTQPSYPKSEGSVCLNYTVVDYDDNQTPKSACEMINQQNVKVWRSDRTMLIKFRPKPMLLTQAMGTNPGVTFFTGRRRNQWINSANIDVAHHGLKIWFTADSKIDMEYKVLIKTYWSFMKPIYGCVTAKTTDSCKAMILLTKCPDDKLPCSLLSEVSDSNSCVSVSC